jgi:hypothetical protein
MSEKHNNILLKIKVTNLESKAIYTHHRVPLEHVETLKMNPNLKIEVLGRSKGFYNENINKELCS